MDPTNITIMNNLANSEKNLFNYRSAEILFLKIIEKKPDYLNAYVNYGNLKKRLKSIFCSPTNTTKKHYKLILNIPLCFILWLLNYQSLGNFELSIEYATKALKIEPTFTQGRFTNQ